jgi:predicted RNA-binding Zn ribbon-like protein
MTTMEIPTPETRPLAPGALGRLQEFLNSGHLGERLPLTAEDTAFIRARADAGESAAALAREFGVPQGFIAAVRRGAAIFDELDSVYAAAEWLGERGFLAAGEAFGERGLARLKELREVLRDFAAANNNHPLPEGALTTLNVLAAANPVSLWATSATSTNLVPAGGADSPALARVLATLFEAMRDGSWPRLKRCPGLGCPFTFYDSSRNRTGTWCSMLVCGNRTKVRNYQQRRRRTASA